MIKRMLTGLAATASLSLLLAGNTVAATMSFNNASGTYTADGVTATVSVTNAISGHGLHYNNVENAIGVGTNNINGALGFRQLIIVVPIFTEAETMTVSFDQEVTIDKINFRQWENDILGFGDEVHFDYSGGSSGAGSLTFSDSGLGAFELLDPFFPAVSLTSFTLRPEQDGAETAVYLHSFDFTVSEVPLPAAAWLFGSAIAGLAVVGRRRRRA